jgi:hypothetical protein
MRITRAPKTISLLLAVWLVLISLTTHPLAAQQAQSQTEAGGGEESDPVYPEKVRSRAAWEYIVNLPGYILYLPFWLVYSAVMPVIGLADTSNFLPRIKDFLVSDDGKRMAFPMYESQYGLGVVYSQRDLFTPLCELQISGMMGLWWRRYFSVEVRRFALGGPVHAGIGGHYMLWTDAPFFGIGNDTRVSERTNFAHRQPSLWASVGLDLGKRLSGDFAFRFERNAISAGRNPNFESTTDWPHDRGEMLPGLEGRAEYLALDLKLEHFSLIQRERSAGGWSLRGGASLYDQLNGDSYNFYKGYLDVTRYIHLFYGRTLSLRAAFEVSRPYKDGEVPFYYLSRLGRRETIRGYTRDRYHDRDSALYSVEYRYPLIKRPSGSPSMNAILFVDWGKVSPDLFKDPFFKGFHTSYGGGFRIFDQKNLNLSFLVAKSRDGYRVYLLFNQ